MKNMLTRLAAVFAMVAALAVALPSASAAQEMPAPEPVTDLSDEELQTFAEIYLEVTEIGRQMQADLGSVQDPEEAQAIQMEAQQAMEQVLQENEMEQERYRRIALTVNQDEELREQFLAVVQELQEEGGTF